MLTMVHSNKAYGRTEHSCIPMYPEGQFYDIAQNKKYDNQGLDYFDDGRSRRYNPTYTMGIPTDSCIFSNPLTFAWPAGDWALGMWVYRTSNLQGRAHQLLFSFTGNTNPENNINRFEVFYRQDTSTVHILKADSDGNFEINLSVSYTWAAASYLYLSVKKIGNVFNLYFNGIQILQGTQTESITTNPGYLWIGNGNDFFELANPWRGHIEDFVVTTHPDSLNDKGDPRPYR